jgi:hypothetical protein
MHANNFRYLNTKAPQMNKDYDLNPLLQKGIHINQIEMILQEKLTEFDRFFYRTPEEIRSYQHKNKGMQSSLHQKTSELDHCDTRLKNAYKGLGDDGEIDDAMTAYQKAALNSWNKDDKQSFDSLYGEYLDLTVKKNVGVNIARLIRKNGFIKFSLELITYTLAFFLAYPIKKFLGAKIPALYQNLTSFHLPEILFDYLYAIVIFFTVRIFIDKLKKKALNWRVNRLFRSYLSLIPVVNRAKEQLNKK